ncbi:hypothetical protein BDW71DRAFT_203538 [Aspergillus fruticulosus]
MGSVGIENVRSNLVPVVEQPLFTPSRKLRVVCIGAGYAGLMLAYKWKNEPGLSDIIDLTIYEKNAGCRGHLAGEPVPAHIYTFSFEPNPDWSSFYATGKEIWEYIKRTTVKYNLDEQVKFNTTVASTIWDDAKGKWNIKVEKNNGTIQEDEADILVNGSGILNKWRWPEINGIQSFQGKLVHSAAWDETLDWTNKRVAIIGNGSSAIQILPQMQRTASKLVTYIRSATWIAANFAAEFTPGGKNFRYTEEQKRKFRENPAELFRLRKTVEHGFNKQFLTFLRDSADQEAAYKGFKETMQKRLKNNPSLCEKLIPSWQVGCRRITPGDGYLEALQEPNVSVEFNPILEITETGIRTSNSTEEFDIIVCATGFDTTFSPSWKLAGKNGIRLADQWQDRPEAYFGICAANMPNYFIFNGPNCPVGHGSLLAAMETTADWVLRWCRKIAKEDIKSITVRSDAVSDYNAYTQEFHQKKTVWAGGCRSWYKSRGREDGSVTAMYAGSVLHYKEILQDLRPEDFQIEYRGPNRFRFMGNGLTTREVTGGPLAYYVYK